jgi:hypothetical protein
LAVVEVEGDCDCEGGQVKLYDPDKLTNGVNVLAGGEEVYFIQAPAQGLWAAKERFKSERAVVVAWCCVISCLSRPLTPPCPDECRRHSRQ